MLTLDVSGYAFYDRPCLFFSRGDWPSDVQGRTHRLRTRSGADVYRHVHEVDPEFKRLVSLDLWRVAVVAMQQHPTGVVDFDAIMRRSGKLPEGDGGAPQLIHYMHPAEELDALTFQVTCVDYEGH